MKKSILLTLIIAILIAILIPSIALCGTYSMFEHKYAYKPNDVLNADSFKGKTKYWEGYINGKLVGYVILSKDWADRHVGYSGKHMETLIGIDLAGKITGVKLLFHSEPIMLIGLDEKRYDAFIKQYIGKDITKMLSIGKEITMDAITGATVTAVVQNAIISESSKRLAYILGLIKSVKSGNKHIKDESIVMSWDELKSTGAVKNIKVTNKQLGLTDDGNFVDLYFGLLTPKGIGENILGKDGYLEAAPQKNDGYSAIFVTSDGTGSFKGSGFVRGGIFDRISLEQNGVIFQFSDRDYKILSEIKALGAGKVKEGGVFIVRNKDFDPTLPFKFKLVATYRIGSVKKFESFFADYNLPDKFLK
jgi:NosR/NirI family nitrous oxide reductase transcriptional regulator